MTRSGQCAPVRGQVLAGNGLHVGPVTVGPTKGFGAACARATDPKVDLPFGDRSDAPLFEERIVGCGQPDPLFRTRR